MNRPVGIAFHTERPSTRNSLPLGRAFHSEKPSPRNNHPHSTQRSPPKRAQRAPKGPFGPLPKGPMGPLGPSSFATERLHNGARVRRSVSATERQYDGATSFGSAGMRASVKNHCKIMPKTWQNHAQIMQTHAQDMAKSCSDHAKT